MTRKRNKFFYDKKRMLKGSGVLVVILSAITFTIYVTSNFAEAEHFSIMQDKYEKNIKEYYEKDLSDIEDFYDRIIEKNNENDI